MFTDRHIFFVAVTQGSKTPQYGQSERQQRTDRKKNEKRRSKESELERKGVKCRATWSGGKSPTELGALRPGG